MHKDVIALNLRSIPARYQTPAAALFVLLLGVAWFAAWAWKLNATNNVVERELQRSISVATGMSNVLLTRYREGLRAAAHVTANDVARLEFLPALREDVQQQIKGQHILKVQIHDPRGIVVFSSQASEIGRDQGLDTDIQSALRGEAFARLIQVDAGGQVTSSDDGKDAVQAFVPSNPGTREKQDAVFEVYADVSSAMTDVRGEAHNVWAIANLAGLSVFGMALAILRRAEEAQRRKDVVTGLPSRENAIKAMASLQRRSGSRRVGWLVIGVQRLRQVSAAYGHEAADELLRQAGARLHALVGGEDNRLFRLGGEAFALLVTDRENAGSDHDYAERLARDVLNRFEAPIECRGHSIVADLSIGISLARDGDPGPEELMNRAEVSLTEAKRRGSGHWLLYVPGLEQGVRERLQSVGGLREALDRKQYQVYYQPFIDARTQELVGCEALVRWKHPTKGIVFPDSFIPILEETGMIVDVGMFVLREACRQAAVWRRQHWPDFSVSVNISARQFADPELQDRIRQVLAETGLPPAALIVEVTETFLAMDPEYAAGVLAALRSLGIRVAIDDFGVGYSSLSSLRRLPVDILKVDRSFMSQAPHDNVDAAIAHAIAALARGLGLSLVAEGVETAAQMDFARQIGCDKVQGYLFARPLDAMAFEAAYGEAPVTQRA